MRLLFRLYCCLLAATSLAVFLVRRGADFRAWTAPLWARASLLDSQAAAREFWHQWCRLQRWRIDWERAVQPCEGRMAWHLRQPASRDRTSAYRSYISQWELRPRGQFSRFFIQSVTKDGGLRSSGGDSWRVYIRQGPSSLAPLVLDHGDGLYEVLFLVMEPGSYVATVHLDHTLCDGYRDPPPEWFTKGVDQGRYRADRTNTTLLGNIGMDFIDKPLGGVARVHFSIQDGDVDMNWFHVNHSCHVTCPLVWSGYGRWVGSHWLPFPPNAPGVDQGRYRADRTNTTLLGNIGMDFIDKPLGGVARVHFSIQGWSSTELPPPHLFKLAILGDSNARRLFYAATKRPLCRQMFRKCGLVENWIYNSRKTYPEHKVKEGDDFNQSIILQQYRDILSQPDMDRPDSVLLFNMGIHYSLVLNFTQYQTLVSSMVRLLTETTADGVTPKYKAHVIWRGTTLIEREKLSREPWPAVEIDAPLFRFHTNQRIQLFHAYATHAMCRARVAVLDMYPLSAAYPRGTLDNVHYDYQAFEPALEGLEQYLLHRRLTGQ